MVDGSEVEVLHDLAVMLATYAGRLPASSTWRGALLRARACVLTDLGDLTLELVPSEQLAGAPPGGRG